MTRLKRGSLRSHVALSLGASAVAAIVTLVTLPYVVNGIGLAQYGLFTLLALASAYVGILDLGFSWTTSRYVADAIERENTGMLDDVIATSLALYAVLGIAGGTVLGVAAPFLIDDVFTVGSTLRDDGVTAARLFALTFPAAMAQTYAAAVLRGAQRFDLTTGLQASSAVVTALSTVAAVALGAGIVGVCAAVVGTQVVFGIFSLVAARWVFPTALRLRVPPRTAMRTLAGFTGKVAVSNLGLQLLYLPNRLAVGVLLPLSAVTRFTVPLALAQRLQVVPAALVSAALPTLTAASARRDEAAFRHTFWRLITINVLILAPVSVVAVLWSSTILTVWVSSDLDGDAASVLRLSIAAVLLNAVASVYFVACDSMGAPGLPAVAAVLAGTTNVVLALVLTRLAGIAGAAMALTLSLGVLVVLVTLLWRRSGLYDLRPELDWASLRTAPVAISAAVATAWIALVWLAEGWIAARGSLLLWTIVCLTTGYGAGFLLFGRTLLGDMIPRVRASGQP